MAVEIALDLSMAESLKNTYALEAWFITPFAMSFPVEIYEISIESGPNTPHFGEFA